MDAITTGNRPGTRTAAEYHRHDDCAGGAGSPDQPDSGLASAVIGEPLTLQRIFGWIMSPVVWLMGVPWNEAQIAGTLMGTKTVLNELIAYLNMSQLPPGSLSPRSRLL